VEVSRESCSSSSGILPRVGENDERGVPGREDMSCVGAVAALDCCIGGGGGGGGGRRGVLDLGELVERKMGNENRRREMTDGLSEPVPGTRLHSGGGGNSSMSDKCYVQGGEAEVRGE